MWGQGAQLGCLTSEHFYRARIWGELWPVSRTGWRGSCWRPPEKLTGSFHHRWVLVFPCNLRGFTISFIFLWQTPSRILTSETYRHIPRNNQGMENTLKSALTGDLCPPASLVLSEYLFLARRKVCLAFTFQSSDTVPGMWFRQWGPTWWSALHSWGWSDPTLRTPSQKSPCFIPSFWSMCQIPGLDTCQEIIHMIASLFLTLFKNMQ